MALLTPKLGIQVVSVNGDVHVNPAGIYLFKVNNRITRTMCEIRLKLTIKTPERHE